MHELYDEPFDATLFFGRELDGVNEQLQAVQTAYDMKNVVERLCASSIIHR